MKEREREREGGRELREQKMLRWRKEENDINTGYV